MTTGEDPEVGSAWDDSDSEPEVEGNEGAEATAEAAEKLEKPSSSSARCPFHWKRVEDMAAVEACLRALAEVLPTTPAKDTVPRTMTPYMNHLAPKVVLRRCVGWIRLRKKI